jgi:hypothetical protein
LLAALLARLETGSVEIPTTRYARSGDVSIAYQIVGEGPPDLVYVDGYVSNVELGWQNPFRADWYERLASFSRLIISDKRGVGVSDRVSEHGLPTLEERISMPSSPGPTMSPSAKYWHAVEIDPTTVT